ncbi:PREDICTED: CD226 antigen [Gavialis gangeticus]|uniref:CD226 antigen n=1 Tax=Gavialis gangeticus TaxID=94835 RepID=UPI00092F0656|nr:PREDICTED: CD226 antigen [Gavialis gangeticus]
MDYLGFLIVLQLYEITVEGRFVDVTVKLASNMQLECIYPKNATITQMSWIKCNETNKEAIATFHPSYGVHIDDKYKDRVYIVNASSEDKSLYFTKTSAADTGFYSCSIQTFPDGLWEKIIQVIQSDVFDASMPQPHPVVTGLGGNLLLMCLYNLGGSVQQVKWERIQRDRIDTIVLCSWSGKKTFGSDFQQRTLIDCTPHVNNTLIIKNFTASDYGIYRCVATGGNKMDVMSFNVMSGK